MKKRFWVVLSLMTLGLTLSACSKEVQETAAEAGMEEPLIVISDEEKNQGNETENTAVTQTLAGEAECGGIYEDKDLSYSVIGVRTNEYEDGTRYLIVKLEVYNHSSADISFSPFDTLTLYGGETEYPVDILADVDIDLEGTITPGNKIIGEAAFDITESGDDNYVLYTGSGFEYSPAIKISAGDIGKTFAEQFEASGVKSDYTTGVPVESEQLTILLNSAQVIPSDEEGREILLLDISVTDNEDEDLSFMLGLNFGGVYTAEGIQLESEVTEWTLPLDVIAHETINGIASFYIDSGTTEFYMTVTPNLDDNLNKENIVFSVQ